MNIYQTLHEDHKKVAGILEKMVNSEESQTELRQKLFSQLKTELLPHMFAEEEHLYSHLENFEKSKDITLEANEEHNLIKKMLHELTTFPVDAEEWVAKVTVLKENIEHHVKEEEEDLFKKSRAVLSKEEEDEILELFLETKEQVLLGNRAA